MISPKTVCQLWGFGAKLGKGGLPFSAPVWVIFSGNFYECPNL